LLLCHPSGHPLVPPSPSLSLMLKPSFRCAVGVDTHGYSTDTYYTDGRDRLQQRLAPRGERTTAAGVDTAGSATRGRPDGTLDPKRFDGAPRC
jgi:hypothetical protein